MYNALQSLIQGLYFLSLGSHRENDFYKTCFQNVFVMLLRRVAREVTSSLLSWHKHYDFNAANFLTSQPMKIRVTNVMN